MSAAPPPPRPTTRRTTTPPRLDPGFAARKRIRKELCDLWADPPAFCRPGASAVTDLLHWEVVIDGPDGSPFAGGTFPVDVAIPLNYPFRPPKLTFKTKVYHPNIDSEGEMVLDIFQDKWSAAYTIHSLLLIIVSVLNDPLLDYPINDEIADLYEDRIDLYEAAAREWTRKYASTPIVSYRPVKAGYPAPDHSESSTAVVLPHEGSTAVVLRHEGSTAVVLRHEGGMIGPLWRRAVGLLQSWFPYRLLHRA